MDCIDLRDAVAALMDTHLPGVEYQAYANYVAGATYSGSLAFDPPLYVVRVYPCEGESVHGQGRTAEAALADFEARALPELVNRFSAAKGIEQRGRERMKSLAMA